MEVSYTLTAEDLRAYLVWSAGQAATAAQFQRARVMGSLVFVLLAVMFALSAAVDGDALMFTLAGLTLLGAIAAWFLLPGRFRATYARNTLNAMLRGNSAYFLGPRTVRISAEGYSVSGPGLSSSCAWQLVDHVASSAAGVYVFVTATQAHVVPRSAFATHEDMQRFADSAEAYRGSQAVADGD